MPPARRHDEEPAEHALSQAAPLAPVPVEPDARDTDGLLALQQTVGNRAVGALLRGQKPPTGGARLPADTQAAMEARLGQDFSEVEVRADAAAATAAEKLGARAYTDGHSIGFAEGEFAPGTETGDSLLAHELAHVAQQPAGGRVPAGRLNPAGHASERQAQAAGRGEPTALNAAPLGLALAPENAAAPVAVDEDPAETRRSQLINESLDVAETRARALLNTSYNDVQDAARDFSLSAQGEIDALPGAVSGYWSVASSIFSLGMTLVAARFPDSKRISQGSTVLGGVQSIAQTYFTAQTNAGRDEPKAAAKTAMQTVGKAVSFTMAALFSELRQGAAPTLTQLALENEDVAALLENGSRGAIDQVVLRYLGVPDPDAAPFYQSVREAMEVRFADWATEQRLNAEHSSRRSQYGIAEHEAEPGRAKARNKAADAAALRSGDPVESLGTQVNQTINNALATGLTLLFTGELPAGMLPEAAPEDQRVDVMEAEPVGGDMETDEQRRELDIRRGVTLADTRAREFLNRHYNTVQDAIRDFVASAEVQIDSLPGSPSGHWAMASTLFGAALGVIATTFPATAVGATLGMSALSTAGSVGQSLYLTNITNERDASKGEAVQAMQSLASDALNSQAGVFNKGRLAISPELDRLAASGDAGVRGLLETPTVTSLDMLITSMLGVPHPDEVSLYKEIREKLEVPFSTWLIRQSWQQKGQGYMDAFRPDEQQAGARVDAGAALRGEPIAGAPEDELRGPSAADTLLDMESESVKAEPALGAAEPQLEVDLRVMRRLVDVENRARTFLSAHHDDIQDAVRHFEISAINQIGGISYTQGDWASMASSLVGVVSSLLLVSMPLAGALVSAGLSIASQAVSGYYTDKAADEKTRATATMRKFALETETALSHGFRKSQDALGPLVTALGFRDNYTRQTLLLGGENELDKLIRNQLRIPNPDQEPMYDRVRRELEVKFAYWLANQQGKTADETVEATKAAAATAEDDAAKRSGTQKKSETSKKD